MGDAVCGEIPEGRDIPLYPVKKNVRVSILLEEHTKEKVTAACAHRSSCIFPKGDDTHRDLTWEQIFLLKKLTQWEEPIPE